MMQDYSAKLSGFGFVKPVLINGDGDVPNQVARVPEYTDPDYTAPEYLETGKLMLQTRVLFCTM